MRLVTPQIARSVPTSLLAALAVAALSMQAQAVTPPPGHIEKRPTLHADYALHEWGLVRYQGGAAELATSGNATPRVKPVPSLPHPMGASGGKPVIYLAPGPTFRPETALSITVGFAPGCAGDAALHEVWPLPKAGAQAKLGASFTWDAVHIEAGKRCGKELVPTARDAACTSLGAGVFCEAAELALYLKPVAHCLRLGDDGPRAPVLLYNGRLAAAPAPLVVTVEGRGATARNATAWPVGPVYLVGSDGKVQRFAQLGAGQVVGGGGIGAVGEAVSDVSARIRKDLVAAGLSKAEADAFVAAWKPDVLAKPYPWKALGFPSAEAIEALVPLRAMPPPRTMVRVMPFTIE